MPGTSTWKIITFSWLELIPALQHIDRSVKLNTNRLSASLDPRPHFPAGEGG